MATRTIPFSDYTGQQLVSVLKTMAQVKTLEKDSSTGRYTNDSIKGMLDAERTGKRYGYSLPNGSSTAITKLGDNAGIAAPTPGVIGTPAVDPYQSIGGVFSWRYVNGGADADGTLYVEAFQGDSGFSFYDANTFVLVPIYWESISETDDATVHYVSDTQFPGSKLCPGGLTPSGAERPYLLIPAFGLARDADGAYCSKAGLALSRFQSYSALISRLNYASTGYCGFSYADLHYIMTMFYMKYATKNTQSVFAGCSSYNYQYAPTVTETGVTRVIISSTNAANLVVGSRCSLGTGAVGVDRGTSTAYDVFDSLKITSIETYDSSNSAVYFDTTATFSTTSAACLSTVPWGTGDTLDVEGDGSPHSNTSGKEPFKLQGIELMYGCYEILGDAAILGDGSTGQQLYTLLDSAEATTSITSCMTASGKYLSGGTSFNWVYGTGLLVTGSGLMAAKGTGASTSTGMCDGQYTNTTDATAREFLAFGHLYNGGSAGLSCVNANIGLSASWWGVGSRLSTLGRKG